MTKVYKANSVAHIVVIVNGKSRRVSFAAKTGGGSTFRTDDEALQKAIESHYRFGELFHLAETIEDKKPKKTAKPATEPAEKPATTEEQNGEQEQQGDDAPADTQPEAEDIQPAEEQNDDESESEGSDNEETDTEEAEEESTALTKVNVTDFEDARDYLSDKFGISRTKIRSQKAVREAAEANGIVFVGL